MFRKSVLYFLLIIILFLATIWFFEINESQVEEDELSYLIRIDPIPHTKELIEQEKYAEAHDYLSYFMNYDYVNQNLEAIELYNYIQETRDSKWYKLKKANSGFWSGQSDENEGQIAAIVSDFLIIGDIRDLGREGKNLIKGEDIDKVSAALSAIGIVATGTALITAGTTLTTVKPTISFLKLTNKSGKMPIWTGKLLIKEAEIIKKAKNLDPVADLLSNIHNLYKIAGTRSTLELLGKSSDLKDFGKLAKFGNTFEKKTSTLLEIAGDNTISVYQKLGDSSKNILLEAATFGKEGINLLERYGTQKFQKLIDLNKSNVKRRMTNLEKQFIESGNKVKFSGKEFIKRDNLFDPKNTDAIGRSNIDRMKQGLAPIGKDGNPVNLHHMKQKSDGKIVELSYTEHKENSNVFHRYAGRNESEIDRTAFDKLRTAYWKQRAKDF